MSLALLLAAMAAVAVALIAVPLLRRRADAPDRAAFDRAVYRDQLAEIERDRARGLIGEAEAAAARTEVERRLLAAAPGGEPDGVPRRDPKPGRALAAVMVVLLPAAAGAIYLGFGAPGLPGQPFAERPRAEAKPGNGLSRERLAALAGMIEARLQESPGEIEGWRLLATLYPRLGRAEDAHAAYRRAMALARAEPARAAAIAIAYGEALFAASDGMVTPGARAAFEDALEFDPGSPPARYYLGLAQLQAGDARGALAMWAALEKDAPADAPWLASLRSRIERLSRELGVEREAPSR